mmetsp:Transcript_13430/g.13619  ORF Transcript_13430/g.13619 Transcript_13430/m.13619 type:complete len:303 (-) Transcript_13430:415-1323(-)
MTKRSCRTMSCGLLLLTITLSISQITASTHAPPPPFNIGKLPSTHWSKASQLANLEQTCEDYNGDVIAQSSSETASLISTKRLVCLPLDERFDPPNGMFSHGHVQTGDKMSLPAVFWKAIMKSGAEVPWLFEVSRVDDLSGPRVITDDDADSKNQSPKLTKVVGGAIDFRSPSNYVFLPHWMMSALGLRPRDIVSVRLIQDVPPGSSVRLRPHKTEFTSIGNHQAVLETELKHYSALVKGTTIPFDYNGKRYWFDVVDLRSAPRGERVDMAKVQDCDIAAEFVRAKDQMEELKRRRAEQEGN